ncbi:MAG: hypothetical protein GEU75_08020 [Dehalococcoidia bacterium]|nr:hypothetical protein [Dehalococcoidia bacterium]
MLRLWPGYGKYQERTSRTIPLVILSPTPDESAPLSACELEDELHPPQSLCLMHWPYVSYAEVSVCTRSRDADE